MNCDWDVLLHRLYILIHVEVYQASDFTTEKNNQLVSFRSIYISILKASCTQFRRGHRPLPEVQHMKML